MLAIIRWVHSVTELTPPPVVILATIEAFVRRNSTGYRHI